jgi:hypothetical protein
LEWHFPLTYAHEGIPLGNGTFGALVWGEGAHVRITVNRADYWDHRGGTVWGEEANFTNLRRWLETGDEANLRRVFEGTRAGAETDPPRPTRLPMGRVDLTLPAGAHLTRGHLNLGTSEATLEALPVRVEAVLMRHDPVLALRIAAEDVRVKSVPPDAPEVLEHFRKYGFPPAQVQDGDDYGCWTQECPGEPVLCVGWLKRRVEGGWEVLVASVYGATVQEARQIARETLEEHAEAGYQQLRDRTASWWAGYWSRIAAVALPDPDREMLYYLGMYKLAGLSVPGSPAATLQSPWVEEYRLPPWQSDYHFNINVQECYWPAFAGNYLPALEPLWEMIKRWEPRLRENARVFAGVPDGLQLPHAVDDRCTCMGGFWTGSVDHGSTAWMGQLMWLQWRFTHDESFLRDTCYPFLKGAMRVYEAMLEKVDGAWSLPVSVSPEYGGANMNAWGRNASFQLACIHFLCRALLEASQLLGVDEAESARWADISANLPLAATDPAGREIWLWEGQPLAESHRHHSHLAGIHPFEIFDYYGNEAHRALIDASINTWTRQGMGLWAGWSMPWAAIIHARLGHGEMADVLLGIYRRCFLNAGYASSHDAQFRGFTLMAGRPEIMQIEATMAASAAVLELLVHSVEGTLRIFPAVPRWWRDVSFDGIRTDGAFLVSGRMEDRKVQVVRILSEAGCRLRLVNPFPGGLCTLGRGDGVATQFQGEILDLETKPGEVIVLSAPR